MKTYCSIPFDKEFWNELNSETDIAGQIVFEEGEAYVQVIPVDEFYFTPGTEQVIEVVLNYTSQVALGLLVSWLYDKLKQKNVRKIVINQEECDLKDKNALENTITKKSDDEA